MGILAILLWKITAPFRQLIVVTGEIIQGRFPDRIPIPADDEIRKIVEALNLMIDKVCRQEAEVKELYEKEKETSTMLSRANEMLDLQSDRLLRKNQQVRQAFNALQVAQESQLSAERLAVTGETSGRVAHEVLNPVPAIVFRVGNDLAQCPEINDSLAGLREILGDWRQDRVITVDIRCGGKQTVEIRVTDNGTGIPAAIQADIFDLHFTTKGKEEGTGLGLGISRKLVRGYGGGLLLKESHEGKGSTFPVFLQL